MSAINKPAKFLEVKATSTSIAATFGNGQALSVLVEALPEGIKHQAMLLGLTNKVRDTAANFSKTNNYEGAIESMEATIQALYDGEWNRGGGGVAGQKMKDLASAIAEVQNASFDKAFAVVEKASPEQRAKWSKNAGIAKIMARLALERLESKAIDLSDDDGLPSFDDDSEIEQA